MSASGWFATYKKNKKSLPSASGRHSAKIFFKKNKKSLPSASRVGTRQRKFSKKK